ncbi:MULTISPECIES: 50S ribosomal protein L3 N(5)-glutamine methyltransferase [unclassified Methylophaga]|jgi:ribosomal protein L3 glutamine methyltransferase|uniref:50S ribosomal protein L3 N(5)-glutamine methyltransferase n=1 Tax=unclassified Methylophaga TaxID=2629249 RepID=UPI0023B5D3F9|nr:MULTISPECIES: 50S ribosomal protein L3 N(5)-glutamine methyltransferase [unclassified Methylophaga]|tara:strand:- start:3263 stop:4189 length:927 start_codon:yes stop_codon:yes gene_type:complete
MIDYLAVQSELNTFRDFLRWSTSRFNEAGLFFGHGNEDAFNEASQLLLSSLHLPVDTLPDVFLDARLTQDEKRTLLIAIEKRIEKRIPLPYLTNEAWFAGLPFFVDERVLIPRSPFAELIETQFQPWVAAPDSITRIIDMCTGSGCIAIALAMAFEQAEVTASDISSDALDVARVNRQKYGLEDQLTLLESDIWQKISTDEKYDLIISNPPYVGAEEMASLPEEYRHEPNSALEADDNGLALVTKILSGAADHLTENGLIFIEVGNTDLAVDDKWPEIAFTWLELENGGHGIFMLDKDQCELFKQLYG